jgi:secondary thiamine-phosphate synthase enzyme
MEIQITTGETREILDVTERVTSLAAGLADGIVLVSAPHTTVALFVSEFDDGLRDDFLKIADRLFQPVRPFSHMRNNNPNTEAHALSALFGTSLVLPVAGGKIRLGTYQRILLFELDGPKTRTVSLTHVRSHAG